VIHQDEGMRFVFIGDDLFDSIFALLYCYPICSMIYRMRRIKILNQFDGSEESLNDHYAL
jgi:hypothetical protein